MAANRADAVAQDLVQRHPLQRISAPSRSVSFLVHVESPAYTFGKRVQADGQKAAGLSSFAASFK